MSRLCIASYYGLKECLASAAKALERCGFTVSDFPLYRYACDAHDKRSDYLELFSDAIASVEIVLFWCLAINPADLEQLRARHPSLVFALFNWDDPNVWHREPEQMRQRASVFDIVFSSCKESCRWYCENGTRHALFLPPAFDPEHYYPQKTDEYACDVSLCATSLYEGVSEQRLERKALVDALSRSSLNFCLYGPKSFAELYPQNYRGYASYDQLPLIYSSSTINISTHYAGFNYCYVNERCMLVTGCGGLLFVDAVPGIEGVFLPDEECLLMEDGDQNDGAAARAQHRPDRNPPAGQGQTRTHSPEGPRKGATRLHMGQLGAHYFLCNKSVPLAM